MRDQDLRHLCQGGCQEGGVGPQRSGKKRAREILDEFDRRAAEEYIPHYAIAVVHASLGDSEQALDRLDRAYEEREGWLPNLKREFFWWKSLHHEPRFQDLMRRMAFPGSDA